MRILTILSACVCALSAQSFEVATIRPTPAAVTRSRYPTLRNGTFSADRVSLKVLVEAAYGKIPLQVLALDWMESVYFDLTGKAPEGTPDSSLQPMLQALLKERFHMEAHLEMREMAVFEMVPAKSGVKLQPFDPAHPPNPVNRGGGAVLVGAGNSSQLANLLSYRAGRPVIDRIGISERLSYTIYYMPVDAQPGPGAADPGIPDLFTAVQEQLGVRLEPKRALMEVVVVDRIDRVASEN